MNPVKRRERIEAFENACREEGLSLTVQRRVIFEAVVDHEEHPTADDVYEHVKERIPGVSRTTVYRTLETLVRVGVICRACSPGSATRFDAEMHRHHHLVCDRCEKLIDIPDEAVRQDVELPDVQGLAFHIRDFTIRFHGLCAQCREEVASEGGADDSAGSDGEIGHV